MSTGRSEDGNMQKKLSSLILTDPEKLECPICHKPFTGPPPDFECENGHITWSIGCSEKALEYYGCKEIVPLIKKHYKFCPDSYFPCSRPDCIVVASRGHISTTNTSQSHSKLEFVLNESFQVTLNPKVHNTLILHEHKHGLQFVLLKSSYHSWMSINRIDFGGSDVDIDIEASILLPPRWEIDDGYRELFENIASSDEEIREFLANGDEEMREHLAALDPSWIPMKVDLLKMTNLSSPNKDKVEAHLLQLPCFIDVHSAPLNFRISFKRKYNS